MPNSQTDFIKDLSELAFASRLKRLRDSLISDVAKIYRSQNINFEPRWFAIFYLLKDHEQLTVGEIAYQLGITQPAVSQLVEMMSAKGLVKIHGDKKDTRKKLVSLSNKAIELVPRLMPLWDDIRISTKELFEKIDCDVISVIGKVEDELSGKDMYTRINDKIKERQRNSISILGYDEEKKHYFKNLNYEWLKKNFTVEQEDEKILSDPENQVISKGGEIFFAELDEMIVGTAALLKHDTETDEISKMAVTEKARGQQVGRKLAEHLIWRAKSRNSSKIVLETSPRLISAMNLYRKLGFVQVPYGAGETSKFKRLTVKMELKLK